MPDQWANSAILMSSTMGMLETHEKGSASGIAIYHEFLLSFRKFEKRVYGFVEGKTDPVFYQGAIEHIIHNDWSVSLIAVGNKDKVISVISEFDWDRFPKKRICFFIDMDLSRYLGDISLRSPNLYITDKYSIENELDSNKAILRALKEIYSLNQIRDQDAESILSKYCAEMGKFKELFVPVMGQILIWRRNRTRAILDDFNLSSCFCVDSGTLSLKVTDVHEVLLRLSEDIKQPLSSTSELSKAINDFIELNGKDYYIRGKYLLWFILEFLESIRKSIVQFSVSYTTAPKMNITIGKKNAMSILGPRICCPASLKTFIQKNYSEYINTLTDGVADARMKLSTTGSGRERS